MTRPWETIASVETAAGTLDLRRRGDKDFLITIRGRVLMTSAAHRSEDALARLACAGLRGKPKARVLVSGLGMGYTLRAALDELSADAVVTVAELNDVVATWCEGPLGPLTGNAALDPRVTVEIVDVAERIADLSRTPSAPRFDAIVLDMYEGPHTRVRPSDPLYGPAAVARTKKALAQGGVFAVWCEAASAGFERALRDAGFAYSLEKAGKGARIHHVYIARDNEKTAGAPRRARR